MTSTDTQFDIGILGVPFDTAVSYRPGMSLRHSPLTLTNTILKGARFGPRAIRAASARQTSFRGFNPRAGINPYSSWAKIIDCGDIPVTPVDNAVALTQMTSAYLESVPLEISIASKPLTSRQTCPPHTVVLHNQVPQNHLPRR